MSANKYANLPDIDTAPDVYETEDVFPSSGAGKSESSDDESALPPTRRGRNEAHAASKEELDTGRLLSTEEASKKFKKAEKKRDRHRALYAYPPSPPSPTLSMLDDSPTASLRQMPLPARLRALQGELAALEGELEDPSNPRLHDVDAGSLIRGLIDVKGRLEKIREGREGRGRLVNLIMTDENNHTMMEETVQQKDVVDGDSLSQNAKEPSGEKRPDAHADDGSKPETRSIIEMDKRVGELEKLVGSSGTFLDEASPLPSPLLPLITRLQNQLTLLTQPRHIDSVSRRLKLLLSDLDRASSLSSSQHNKQSSAQAGLAASDTALQETLSRLAPSLPHIPHILTRLRTLSALHTAAGSFSSTLTALEEEQTRSRTSLNELQGAVERIEQSLEENRTVVKGNVSVLEGRIEDLLRQVDEVTATPASSSESQEPEAQEAPASSS